ncbi:MAG: hypothetical protein ABSD20_01270 [Terriglobales bacterium]|jgi:hypothetical protein
MRTTIEMKPEHRSALLAMAADRGRKGFSDLVAEAVESYLRVQKRRERQRKVLLSLAGSISSEEAARLRESTGVLRRSWR